MNCLLFVMVRCVLCACYCVERPSVLVPVGMSRCALWRLLCINVVMFFGSMLYRYGCLRLWPREAWAVGEGQRALGPRQVLVRCHYVCRQHDLLGGVQASLLAEALLSKMLLVVVAYRDRKAGE